MFLSLNITAVWLKKTNKFLLKNTFKQNKCEKGLKSFLYPKNCQIFKVCVCSCADSQTGKKEAGVAAAALWPSSSSPPSCIFQQPYGAPEFLSFHHLWRVSLQTLTAVLVHVDVGFTHNGRVCVCAWVCGWVCGVFWHKILPKPFTMGGHTHTHTDRNTQRCRKFVHRLSKNQAAQVQRLKVKLDLSYGCRCHSALLYFLCEQVTQMHSVCRHSK